MIDKDALLSDVIDVDIGNTYIKWRQGLAGPVDRQLTASLLTIGWQCHAQQVTRVRVASVADDKVNETFNRQVMKRWAITPEFAVVTHHVAGVKPCYTDLRRLGVDRWLAMVAAFSSLNGACVVVSAGSALTADWLDERGQHLGGLIAPGRQRLVASLHRDLARVLHSADLPALEQRNGLGQNTESCSAAGVRVLLSGFMAEVINRNTAPIWLAGGDTDAMLSVCHDKDKHRVKTVNNMVLDGLAIALP
ncbi:type III pantothenate kinase [Marinagarivorans algicola]|uniref:type III pantothenate kinase n=1 Tax=Marinagarivorans algicola TaxID=1513270 RepID=UPI0006B41055|nr:type III pantothenate kinase [Marinagarivorans algicola]